MISNQNIICISSIEWDFLWQGHQEIAKRLAENGNRVLYIENTGVRAPAMRDASRVVKRLKHWAGSLASGGVREVAPNIYVCAPLVLPPFGARWQRYINRKILLPLVRRAAYDLDMRDALIWTYLPTDTALDLIALLRTPHSPVVYYCVDNFAQLTTQARRLRHSERAVLEASDAVFATCQELADSCARWNDNVHIFPFGVNLEAFPAQENSLNDASDTPRNGSFKEDVSGDSIKAFAEELPRPIIGYVGGLHRHVDFDLLIAMARARPLWSWVFVGAIQTSVGELAELPNVRLLGQRPHQELVNYIREYDACIVPYVDSLYTATVVPTKINEYLAVGKPVISTPLPAVCEFNNQHNILRVAPTRPEQFLQAIEQSLLLPKDAAILARRREVATFGDWQARLEAMSNLIEVELKAHQSAAQINKATLQVVNQRVAKGD